MKRRFFAMGATLFLLIFCLLATGCTVTITDRTKDETTAAPATASTSETDAAQEADATQATTAAQATTGGPLSTESGNPSVLTVKFNSVGGSAVETQTVEYGGTATKPEDPVRPGYAFMGWTDYAGDDWDFDAAVTRNATLYAVWNRSALTLSINGGASVGSETALPFSVDATDVTAETIRDANRTDAVFEYGTPLAFSKPKDADEIGAGRFFPTGTPVTDEASASDPGNWYTARNGHVNAEGQITDNDGVESLSSFSGYVIRKTVSIAVPEGRSDGLMTVTAAIARESQKSIAPMRVMVTSDGGEFFILSAAQPERAISFASAVDGVLTLHLYVYADGSDPEAINSFNGQDLFSVNVGFGTAVPD